MTNPTGPLKGLRVLDLTRVLAGPTCAQMLGDLGAEVIKIERPGAGDDTRGFAPPFMPGTKESAYFVGVNRNKMSVTLDIGKPEGQEIALRLIAAADLVRRATNRLELHDQKILRREALGDLLAPHLPDGHAEPAQPAH